MTQNTKGCPQAKIDTFIKQLQTTKQAIASNKPLQQTLYKLQKDLQTLEETSNKHSCEWIVK